MRHVSTFVVAVVVVIVAGPLAGCGSKAPTTATPAAKVEPAKPVLPDVPFDKLDHDQRVEFMKQKVVPALEPIFKAHDAQKYAQFGCKTCHGKQVDKDLYDMPNTELPLLGKDLMQKFKPEQIEWMAKQVKPTMAKLLGQTEWEPSNPTGFGCHGCHPVQE